MLKKTIEYVDYNGNKRKEDFYFNLTKAEIAEMELTTEGGLEKKLQRIVDAQDGPELIELFKDLILRSYGVKSDDGRRFMKNSELRQAFSETEPYSILFVELASSAEAAKLFVEGIIPKFD